MTRSRVRHSESGARSDCSVSHCVLSGNLTLFSRAMHVIGVLEIDDNGTVTVALVSLSFVNFRVTTAFVFA